MPRAGRRSSKSSLVNLSGSVFAYTGIATIAVMVFGDMLRRILLRLLAAFATAAIPALQFVQGIGANGLIRLVL